MPDAFDKVHNAKMRDRIEKQYEVRHEFGEAQFLASLDSYRGNMSTGALNITLSVPPAEKDAAYPVTDAGSELLLVTIKKVRFNGSP